jgi:carbon-monoxide dehydrogenase small subunit
MRVNGRPVLPRIPTQRLLDFVRDELDLTGSKEGCGMGECGACTVLVGDEAVCSCLVLVGQVADKEITTVEGLLSGADLHPVQQSFIDAHASQCGYCTPGMVVSVAALLVTDLAPDDASSRRALVGNLCRCTGYRSIFDAARSAGA